MGKINPGLDIIVGDCRETLSTLPNDSVHCVVTSPPYWDLRDYGVSGQIGLESSLDAFMQTLVRDVFGEIKRVLHPHGTCWVNLGDTYKDKQMLGVPWAFAFAMKADGWKLRSDIIWHKPNPVPEPDRKRPTVSHEYFFLFAKSDSYHYDTFAIREPVSNAGENYPVGQNVGADSERLGAGYRKNSPTVTHPDGRNKRSVWTIATEGFRGDHYATFPRKLVEPAILAGTSERGCCSVCGNFVERVTKPSEEYNKRLGTSWHDHKGDLDVGQRSVPYAFRGGVSRETTGWRDTCECKAPKKPCVVLDPFAGTGTTGEVAMKHGRSAILLELNPKYVEFIKERCGQQRLDFFGIGEAV